MLDFLNKYKKQLFRWGLFVLFVLFVLILLFAPIGVYVGKWGFSLSTNHTIWGEFGSFLSGIYAPILSILSLCVILYQTVIIKKQMEIADEQRNISARQTELIGTQAKIAEEQKTISKEQTNIQEQQLKLETDFQNSDVERSFIETKRYYLGIYINTLDNCLKRSNESPSSNGKSFKHIPLNTHFKISNVINGLRNSILSYELNSISDDQHSIFEDMKFLCENAPELLTNWQSISAIIHELRSSEKSLYRDEGIASFIRVGNVLGLNNCESLDVFFKAIPTSDVKDEFHIKDYFYYDKYQKYIYKD